MPDRPYYLLKNGASQNEAHCPNLWAEGQEIENNSVLQKAEHPVTLMIQCCDLVLDFHVQVQRKIMY